MRRWVKRLLSQSKDRWGSATFQEDKKTHFCSVIIQHSCKEIIVIIKKSCHFFPVQDTRVRSLQCQKPPILNFKSLKSILVLRLVRRRTEMLDCVFIWRLANCCSNTGFPRGKRGEREQLSSRATTTQTHLSPKRNDQKVLNSKWNFPQRKLIKYKSKTFLTTTRGNTPQNQRN